MVTVGPITNPDSTSTSVKATLSNNMHFADIIPLLDLPTISTFSDMIKEVGADFNLIFTVTRVSGTSDVQSLFISLPDGLSIQTI